MRLPLKPQPYSLHVMHAISSQTSLLHLAGHFHPIVHLLGEECMPSQHISGTQFRGAAAFEKQTHQSRSDMASPASPARLWAGLLQALCQGCRGPAQNESHLLLSPCSYPLVHTCSSSTKQGTVPQPPQSIHRMASPLFGSPSGLLPPRRPTGSLATSRNKLIP